MKMPRSRYEQTKICDEPYVKEMAGVQDLFSIVSIDAGGIFELPGKKFSRLYVLSDINFSGVTDEEPPALALFNSALISSCDNTPSIYSLFLSDY